MTANNLSANQTHNFVKGLLQLSQVSRFRPKTNGLGHELFELVMAGQEREEAINTWISQGRSEDSFRQAYKKLKDGFIREAFLDDKGFDLIQRRRILCWDRFQKIKCLMIADKKAAAIPLAIETIVLAQKCGFTEIVFSLGRELEHHYGAIVPDKRRYLRYRKIRKTAHANLAKEYDVQSLFTQMVFNLKSGKGLIDADEEWDNLRKEKTGTYLFMLYRCNILTILDYYRGNYQGVVKVIKFTLKYFRASNTLLPFTVRTNLFHQLLPLLIAQKSFAEAEKQLTLSLKLPATGSYMWHQLMLQRAYLGFHSDKPKIVLNTWIRASKNKKHDSPVIDEQWRIVRAYLAIYEKFGHLAVENRFRLARFLNSVPAHQQDKKEGHVAILIVELMLLLLADKRKAYMQRVESLPSYIYTHLRGKGHVRCRSILYMLKKVEEGDYHKIRVMPRVTRWQNLLTKHPLQVFTASEIIPYKKLWEIVCSQLR